MKWDKKWKVSSGVGGDYVVAYATDTITYGCSCPVWKFRREKCKHIAAVEQALSGKLFTGFTITQISKDAPMEDKAVRKKAMAKVVEPLTDGKATIEKPNALDILKANAKWRI